MTSFPAIIFPALCDNTSNKFKGAKYKGFSDPKEVGYDAVAGTAALDEFFKWNRSRLSPPQCRARETGYYIWVYGIVDNYK